MTKTTRARVMKCPAASHWLKQALAGTERRDIVDAVNDAEVLLGILQDELSAMEQQHASIESRIYSGELEATDGDGVQTMGDFR